MPLYIIAGGMFIGLMAPYTVPIQIGATSDGLGLDPAQAGLLGTLELLGLALTSIVMASLVTRVSWRHMAMSGLLLAMTAQFLSALTGTYLMLGLFRLLAGVGSGCVLAAFNTVIAVSRDPERVYGRVTAVMASVFVLLLLALPHALTTGGYRLVYLSLAVLVAAAVPLVLKLPHAKSVGAERSTDVGRIPWSIATLLFVAMTLVYVTQGGIYSSSERIGTLLGIAPGTIGLMLGASTVAGVCGAGLAGWIGTRWGRVLPLLIGVVLSGVASLTIAFAGTAGGYLFGLLLYGGVFMFTSPYVLGAAAALDPSARLATMAIGYQLIAYGLGPVVFGLTAREASYAATGWPALAACVVAAGLLVPVVNYLASAKPSDV